MNYINKRKMLEKKYCNICLHNKLPLEQKGDRVLSVSPGSYFYHTGINATTKDVIEYKRLSKKAHNGYRLYLENEVNKIVPVKEILKELKINYFFEFKNAIVESSFEELNGLLYSLKIKTLKKYQYNRMVRLLKIWGKESTKYHYFVTGAKRRLHYKYLNKEI